MKASTLASVCLASIALPALAALAPLSAGTPGNTVGKGAEPSVFAQGDDLAALVDEEAAAAGKKSLAEIWTRAVELRDAEILGEPGELDRLLDAKLGAKDTLEPRGTFLLAASRLQGDEPDVTRIADAIVPFLDAGEQELSQGAAELLEDPAFKRLNPSRSAEIAKKMLDRAEDATRSPSYRLQFATSAWTIGGGKERVKANSVLHSFLDSEDVELRTLGALALAELDAMPIEGELRVVLERMAKVPDARGELAKSYLEREELRESSERKLRDLQKKVAADATPPELAELVSVLNMIQERHLEGDQITREELVEHAIQGMLQYMDPHSALLSPKIYGKFFQELEAEYGGIGAYVNDDPDDGLFTIVRPIYTGPAYRAGLMTYDKVVKIDDWPTLGQPVDDIILRLKGKPGTPVSLYIWRHGMDPELIERPTEDMKVVITREQVRIPPGTFQMLPGGIGLLELNTFSQVSMDEAKKWIPEMMALGMRALILDMRFNQGGLLTEAREVAELFLPKKADVVSTEGRPGILEKYKTRHDPVLPLEIPLVVLTGRQTASAAEIVSGALQDHKRAILVGKTTFGKGSVQQLLPVASVPEDEWDDQNNNGMFDRWETITKDYDGDGEVDYSPRVKLTIARYLLPSGRSIHRDLDREGNVISEGGVKPDHEIDPPLIERWRFKAQQELRDEIRAYADRYFPANRELFGRLAVNDQHDASLYPGFDELMAGLDTQLSKDDVRRVLRTEIRRRVQDDRGAEFPIGDFVEDVQVQKAIEVALSELGETVEDIADYDLVFDLPVTEPEGDLTALNSTTKDELRRARALIEEARSGGAVLTEQDLDELLQVIEDLEAKKN